MAHHASIGFMHSYGLSEEEDGREDECTQEVLSDYNMPLHIVSVFILLVVSILGSLSPVVLRISRFGTVLSTAFIHMMLPAVESLMSPCLSSWWIESYEGWPFLFCTIAVMFMQAIDYLINGYLRRRCIGIDKNKEQQANGHVNHGCHAAVIGTIPSTQGPQTPPSIQLGDAEAGEANEEGGSCPVHDDGCSTLLAQKLDTARMVGIYFTEAGINFHSVILGVTLGVASGTSFKTLLAALSVHQFFEGFALGSAAVDACLSSAKCVILGLAYSVTTPVGMAVGIAVRKSFNQNSTSNLLATSILDSLSSGVLIYVVLVQLITPLFTNSIWLHIRCWPMQVLAFVFFYAGAAIMAVIGNWV